jgi:hypothetical protein
VSNRHRNSRPSGVMNFTVSIGVPSVRTSRIQ